MGRIFNIAGPCNPEDHYMLPALERIPNAMYCSLEVVQEFPDPADGMPMIYEKSHEKAYDQVCGYMLGTENKSMS